MHSFRCQSLLAWRSWGTLLQVAPLCATIPQPCSTTFNEPSPQGVPEYGSQVNKAAHTSLSSPAQSALTFSTQPVASTTGNSYHACIAQSSFSSIFTHSVNTCHSLHTTSHAAAITREPKTTWTSLTDNQPPSYSRHPPNHLNSPPPPIASHHASSSADSSTDSTFAQTHMPSLSHNAAMGESNSSASSEEDSDADLEFTSPYAPTSLHTLPSTYYRLPPEAPTQGTFPQVSFA